MNNSIKRSQNGYTFDTNVGIKICKNSNVGSLLACRIDFENSDIHLSSQTLFEVKRLGLDIDSISKQIKSTIGANIIKGYVTDDMQDDADYLENVCPTLHNGDSQILAYTRATGTTLITCDRGLAKAAELTGTDVVNPDLLPCDVIANDPKSKYRRLVKQAIAKTVTTKRKVRSFSLKPGEKITWRSFN